MRVLVKIGKLRHLVIHQIKKIYEDIFSHKENLVKTAFSVFCNGGDTGTMIFSSKKENYS